MTFNARFIANIIHFAGQQGANRQALLELAGKKNLAELLDPELQFDAPVYNQILEKCLNLTNDPYFGLHVGESLSLSAAGLIVQIVQSCTTVLEALQHIVAFANLGCSALPYQLRQHRDEWELYMEPHPLWVKQSPASVRHTMDGAIVFTLREYHSLTRHQHYPLRIHFTYPRPEKFMEYERLFRCPVHFGQPTTAIFMDSRQVEAPIITSDYHLLQILVRHAEEKLARMQEGAGFSSIVRHSILNLVKPQFPTIEQVASNLNISVRTLQRRLKAEDQTYKSVLEELKRQLALDYLRNDHLSVKEIAFLLDYADASSFIRSFRRWEGKSPEVYRQDRV